MPVIPTQVSREQISTYRAEPPQFDDSVGEGMRQIGNALGNLVGLGAAAREKEKRRAALEAATGFATLSENLQQDLTVQKDEAAIDGNGLADGFNTKSLTPKTEAFLAAIPDPELRDEYRLRLQPLIAKYKNDAVNAEYDKGNSYSIGRLGDLRDEKAVGIATDPAKFENWVTDYEQEIDRAPNITPTQREELKRKWRQAAPSLLAETLQANDPETLYFATGHGTSAERRSYVVKSIIGAVAQQESSGNPNTPRSSRGATGIMQVMPETGTEIAKELHDANFPVNGTEQEKADYLQIESVSYRYGAHYLEKMLKQNHDNLTLALIAYNAGQQRADEFVEKGGDWSKMGAWAKETQPYVSNIIESLGTKRFATNIGIPKPAGETPGLGSGARLPPYFGSQAGRVAVNTDFSKLNPELLDKWTLVQGAFGKQLPIVSGYRGDLVQDPKTGKMVTRNELAGGASGSQHLTGDAIDIDVSKLSKAERIKLIETASAAGMTGIGVYNNSIHFDVRDARKAWGPSHGYESVPGWAKSTVMKHLAGVYGSGAGTTIVSGGGGAGRPGAIPSGPGGAAFVAASGGKMLGMITPGNINLHNRPVVKNADGSISTVRSRSFNIDGKEVLVPTVSEDGRIMSDEEALKQYKATGRHLGIFESATAATKYAQQLHEEQDREYRSGESDQADGFLFEGFRDMSPAALVQTMQQGRAGVKRSDEAAKLAKEQAKAEANDMAKQDIASLRYSGKAAIAPENIEAFQEKLMLSDGPAAVMQWARDRARAQRVFTMTENLSQMSSSQLEQLLDQSKPSGGAQAAEDEAVYKDVVAAVDAEQAHRLKDPGEAVQDHPAVKELAKNVNYKVPASVEDYITRVFQVQDALGIERTPLPKAKADMLGQAFTRQLRMNPEADPSDVTKRFLMDLQAQFGTYADEVFLQALDTTLEKNISKDTRNLVTGTMLDWIKHEPGANDPNYRRLKARHNWNYGPELAAQDKAAIKDTFDYLLPAEVGSEAGAAVRSYLQGPGMQGDWGPTAAGKRTRDLLKGTGPYANPPAAPENIPQAPRPQSGVATRPGSLSSLRPPTVRINGVPDAAFDLLATNPGDPAAQNAFKKQFGGDAFTEAMKILKQGGGR